MPHSARPRRRWTGVSATEFAMETRKLADNEFSRNRTVQLALELFNDWFSKKMSSSDTDEHSGPKLVIPLLEEEARVEAQQVATGKVRIKTITDLVEETATAILRNEEVEVVRVP